MLDEKVEQRILSALHHEEPDRVPIWDYIDNNKIYRYIAGDEDDYNKGMVKVYHKLGIDLCRGYGASFSEDEERTFRSLKTEQKRAVFISGQTAWMVDSETGLQAHRINSLEELRNYEVPSLADEHFERMLETVKKRIKMFEPYTMYVPGMGCGWDDTFHLMGLELFSIALYRAREDVNRVMRQINDNCVKFAKMVAEEKLCPIYFTWSDIAFKGRTMVSPKILKETLIPCLKRVCDPLKKAGIKVIFHSDGYIPDEVIDYMIDVGVDGLNPIEPMAGMNIRHLKEKYGDKLVLVGNVDCSQVLPLGSVKDVVEATKQCIRDASSGGGHFIGSSSEITPSTPIRNILAFYEACHKYGRYPARKFS